MRRTGIFQLFLIVCLLLFTASNVIAQDACEGNFNCDQDVDGTDASVFKEDFGRSPFSNPCPSCNPCPYNMVDCGNKCVDPMTDEEYCGVNSECTGGTICGAGEICSVGVCNGFDLTCQGTLSTGERWCDQDDGTVKDMTNGLVWLKKADWGGMEFWSQCYSCAFPDAHSRVSSLYAGMAGADLSDGSVEGDWRLPTKAELYNIVNGTEAVRSSSMQLFTGVSANCYWSTTTFTISIDFAWCGSMADGGVYADTKDYPHHVWPVRGGQ